MIHVVLHNPEIPQNTGNIIRLCANTGAALHLVEPLGFELDDSRLRRAGLDYHEYASLRVHPSFDAFVASVQPGRCFALTTGGARSFTDVAFRQGDALIFGAESRGLPAPVKERIPEAHRLRIPMRPDNRSLNLSNAVAVAVYEVWRQFGFDGAI
ncbi:MAG: tRNA (uridine(34)/cytosine(34)/5-carboxymethylaminomethyluridine(34)-2'-O)-methyltransferase TrmL [Thiohalobacteraceae bacterium]|nr:tRNA (uridine(34)/cytosine(34)/5-carboxymethylaminomethyluridine(34)-2'-O)-methyltransferase TrmL [Gammaproteobacteria bacterium]